MIRSGGVFLRNEKNFEKLEILIVLSFLNRTGCEKLAKVVLDYHHILDQFKQEISLKKKLEIFKRRRANSFEHFFTHKKISKQRNEKMKKSAQIMLIACSEILSSSRSFHCQSHSSTLIWETKGEQSKRESIWGFIKSWIRAKNGKITKKRHTAVAKAKKFVLRSYSIANYFIHSFGSSHVLLSSFKSSLVCFVVSFISINRQERT